MSLLDLTPQYSVRWRNWAETIQLMSYDINLRQLRDLQMVRVEEELFRVGHEAGNVDLWSILEQPSLRANSDGLLEISLLSSRRVLNVFPRVEVIRTVTEVPVVIATLLPGGKLIVRDASEGELPDTDDQMVIQDKVSFSSFGLIADTIREIDF